MNQEIKYLKERVKDIRVLYCEDEEDMRVGSELFFNKFFRFVDSASDGKYGLEKFKQNKYDVVFTDIMMPNMDGLEMLKNIKEIDNNIFSVILTASDITDKDVDGASNFYFRKPISYENMISIMKEIIKKFDL